MSRQIKPSQRCMARESDFVRKLVRSWDNLEVKNGLLMYRQKSGESGKSFLLVLPKAMREQVFKHLHDSMGHLGFDKVFQQAKERFFYPGLYTEVQRYLAVCKRCALHKTSDTKKRAVLEPIHTTRPLELVCIDFLSLEAAKGGYEHVLVVTDHYTRYAQAYAARDEKATTVARILWEKFILHYGIPERIHSDQGKSFENSVVRELCHLLGVTKSRTTPYHPQGNGMTERFNRTLLSMLGTLEPSQKVNWAMHLQSLTHAYNCAKHESTGYSPFYLMFLREPRLPVDVAFDPKFVNIEEDIRPQSTYVRQLEEYLQKAREAVESAADKARQKQKAAYDKNVKDQILTPGDKVLVANRTPQGRCKLKDKWEAVPHIVVRQFGELPVYTVRPLGSTKTRNLHRNMLSICPFEVEDETTGTFPSSKQSRVDRLSRSVEVRCRGENYDVMSVSSDGDSDQSEFSDHSVSSNSSSRRMVYQRPRRVIKPPSRLGEWF